MVTNVQGSEENRDRMEEFVLQYRVRVRTQPRLCKEIQAEWKAPWCLFLCLPQTVPGLTYGRQPIHVATADFPMILDGWVPRKVSVLFTRSCHDCGILHILLKIWAHKTNNMVFCHLQRKAIIESMAPIHSSRLRADKDKRSWVTGVEEPGTYHTLFRPQVPFWLMS